MANLHCAVFYCHIMYLHYRRGVDVGSNHHLVTAYIKLQIKRTETPIRLLKWFDISKVKDSGIRPVVQY